MKIDLQNLEIKKVVEKDIDLMIFHRINYLTEMQGNRDTHVVENLKTALSAYFHEGIKNGSIIALVAEHKKEIVSYGAIVLRTIPGDLNCSFYFEGDILNMYTVPTARQQGISTLLLKQLIEEARLAGVSKLALHTSVAGKKLYRSAGFTEPVFPYLELSMTI